MNELSIIFQGGFAKCYEMKNLATGEIMACKVVPKSLLTKQNQREKMAQEIRSVFYYGLPFKWLVKKFLSYS